MKITLLQIKILKTQDFIKFQLMRFMEVASLIPLQRMINITNSPYSASKASADMLIRSFNKPMG